MFRLISNSLFVALDRRYRESGSGQTVVLAATDPVQPYGAVLAWPESTGRPTPPPPPAATAVCGMLGCFGPFGSTVETAGDFVMLSVLAFAMGLQNASVATTTGMIVRTTHMTGPVTDFSIALAMLLSAAPEASRQAALMVA